MVNAAKDEPEGLGSLAEEVAIAGQFFVPDAETITEHGQGQVLLHATVEELIVNLEFRERTPMTDIISCSFPIQPRL